MVRLVSAAYPTMMITISRDGQQFGPYTLEDARAHLASGALLATDLAWYEGAPDWMPLDQVPGIAAQPGIAAAPDPNDPLAAANPAVAAAGVASATAAQGSKKKTMIIAGSAVGVLAIAGVLLFVYPGFLKKGGGEGSKPSGGLSSGKGSGDEITFSKVIEPIFRKHKCYDCHSSVNDKVREDLDFDKPETVEEVVKNGKLVKRLKDMGDDRMPPEGKGDRLSPSDIKKVEAWVAWKVKP